MQFLSATISIGGDDRTQVVREWDNPISYPELLVLMALHGSDAVRDIALVEDRDVDNDAERSRLAEIYGQRAMLGTFPVQHMPLPERDPRYDRVRRPPPAPAPAPRVADPFAAGDERGSLAHVMATQAGASNVPPRTKTERA